MKLRKTVMRLTPNYEASLPITYQPEEAQLVSVVHPDDNLPRHVNPHGDLFGQRKEAAAKPTGMLLDLYMGS